MSTHPTTSPWSASQFVAAVARREDPFVLLEQFASSWYAPLGATDGFPTEDLDAVEVRRRRPLPQALRRWYALAGRCRPLVGGNSDQLAAPSDPVVANEQMEFLRECQGLWSLVLREVDLSGDDPLVYVDDRENVTVLGPTLSTFALQWALYSAKFAAPFTASACITNVETSRLKADAPQLPWRSWQLFGPHFEIRLHAADDLVVEMHEGGGDDWVWIGARTVEAIERAMNCVETEWDAFVGQQPYAVWRAERDV